MKEKIKLEYHIDPENLIEKDHYYLFESNNNFFYLTEIRRNEEEIKEIIKLYEELKTKNYPVHTIVKKVDNSLFLENDGKKYLLTIVNGSLEKYSLFDMLKLWDSLILTKEKSVLQRTNWAFLWSEKVDYFEYQIRELGKNKKTVLNTFSYYVGLCENAISYVNRVNKNVKPVNTKLALCRRRVWYPNYHLNYDNPLQFIIDLEVRDVAEYLKGLALEDEELALIDLKSYLDIRKPDLYSLGMLYGRLIYPSYYFDLYEQVMNFDVNEDCLIKIIDKSSNMELFLKKSYELIYQYGPIEPIEWLIKKEVIN